MTTNFIQARVYSPDTVAIMNINKKVTEVQERVGEILDTFTEQISPEGKLIFTKSKETPKEEAHNTWELHLATHIWMYNSLGEILIQRRAQNKYPFPGLWDFSAAGHLESGEDFKSGGLREMTEEIGLKDINPDALKLIGIYREEIAMLIKGKHWHNNELDGVFILRHEINIDELKMQVEEVWEMRLIHVDDLEKEWNNEITLAQYTPKSKEYRALIIAAIRKSLQNP